MDNPIRLHEKTSLHYPDQRVSDATKRTAKHYRPTIDYKIKQAESYSDNEHRLKLLNAADGVIDSATFDYIMKPFAKANDPELKKFIYPGELRDTGLIKDIILKLLSEYSLLNHNYQVKVNNSDVILRKNAAMRAELEKYVNIAVVEELQKLGVLEGGNEQAMQNIDIASIMKKKRDEWVDQRAIDGQDMLDALRDWTDDEVKYREAYFYYIVLGEYYSWRYPYGSVLRKEIVPALEAFPIPNSSIYVEDYDGFLWKRHLTWVEFLNEYRHEFSDADQKYIKDLDEKFMADNGDILVPIEYLEHMNDKTSSYYNNLLENRKDTRYAFGTKGMIELNELTYISERKIGILKYTDALGNVLQMQVNEDYKIDTTKGDIEVVWDWIPTPYRALRVGTPETGVYLPPKPLEVTRGLLHGTYNNKLNFGGKRGLFRFDFNHSIPERLLQFEVMGRIIQLAIERQIARGLITGDVQLVPLSMLGSSKMSVKDTVSMAIVDGRWVYDDTNPTAREAAVQGFRYVQSSRTETLKALVDLYNINKSNAWDAIGWNRQRDGESFASDGKAVTRDMLMQSMKNIAIVNESFNKAREKDYESDLDFGKYALLLSDREQSLGSFRTPDGEIKYLNIDGSEIASTIMGVYVENSAKEEVRLQKLTDIAFSAAQNGEWIPAIEATLTDNTSKVKQILLKYVDVMKNDAKQAQEAQNRALVEAKQIESETKNNESQVLIMIEKLKQEGENYRKNLDLIAASGNDGNDREMRLKEEAQRHKETMDKLYYDLDSYKARSDKEYKDKQLKNRKTVAK